MNEITTPKQLVKMVNRLMKASLRSKIPVKVGLDSDPSSVRADIVFFKDDNTNFSIFLYEFWSEEKNNKFIDMAIDLMLDPSKYDEIKEKSKDC